MKLGVNGIRLIGKRSGVGRAIEAILRCMSEMDQPFRDIVVYTPRPVDSDVALPAMCRNVVLPSPMPYALWEQITLPRAHGSRDVLFCPSYVVPLAARCPTLLVHHGSYEGYPQAFGLWVRTKARAIYTLSARRATTVSTVSQYSKQDMVRFYGLDPERIHVIPEGVDTRRFRPGIDGARLSAWRAATFGTDTPFIVYVGKPTERRNLSPLIRAFGLLKREERIPHKFLVVGADLPGTSPFRRVIEEERLGADVVVRGYVQHDEMVLVYNGATALVYPSSYEGFGMPVLEAMACGTPVVTLDNTAFPEFAGGVALLLKNADVHTLRDGIRAILADPALRARMAEAGPVRAAEYDWRRVTAAYVELLIQLACQRATRPAMAQPWRGR